MVSYNLFLFNVSCALTYFQTWRRLPQKYACIKYLHKQSSFLMIICINIRYILIKMLSLPLHLENKTDFKKFPNAAENTHNKAIKLDLSRRATPKISTTVQIN